jgi:hypothetical protein
MNFFKRKKIMELRKIMILALKQMMLEQFSLEDGASFLPFLSKNITPNFFFAIGLFFSG